MQQIKIPEEKDIPYMKKQWKSCFGDSDEYIECLFRLKFKRENTLALYHDGMLVSYLMMFPKTLSIKCRDTRACYIGGVCTHEDFRRRGYAAQLLSNAFEKIKADGYAFAYLIPVRCGFYERLGYKCVSYLTVLEGEISHLPSFNERGAALDNRIEVYNAMCRGREMYEKRTAQDFSETEEFVRLEGGRVFCTENAYMYYKIADGVFEAYELAFANYSGFCEMISFIGDCRSAEKFRIRGSFELCNYICEKNIAARLVPYAMVKSCTDSFELMRNTDNYINMPVWE